MEKLVKPARIAFCISLVGMTVPLCIYGSFEGYFLPPWPHMPFVTLWCNLIGLLVVAASAAILFSSRPRAAALLLAALMLLLYIDYLIYDIFFEPANNHLMAWASEPTESTLAGGAFVVARSLPREPGIERSGLLKTLEKLIPAGPFLFCATMIFYGILHLVYPQLVSQLVPGWIPWPVFWTWFAGFALILAGIAIVSKIKLNAASFLLGCMIFIWFCVLHLPRGIDDLMHHRVFEFSRSFGALAYSSTAFMIAGMATLRRVET